MKVLVTGGNGQLGRCLQDRLKVMDDVEWHACDVDTLDILDLDAIRELSKSFAPDVIINAAAYTAVDKAETDTELAYAINELGPKNLAVVAKELSIPLVHVSTDYVFNGESDTPYQPTDETGPQSVYGASKLAGEQAIADTGCRYLIVRTAWVFSEYGNNFVKTMLRVAKERNELSIVADQVGCPTYAGHLADAILAALPKVAASDYKSEVFHYSGDESCSWYDFAVEIFRLAVDLQMLQKAPVLKAVGTPDYPTPAKRPAYSVLDSSRFCNAFGVVPGNWKAALFAVMGK